jgi:serine protease Do
VIGERLERIVKANRRLILLAAATVVFACGLGFQPGLLQGAGDKERTPAWLGVSVGKIDETHTKRFGLAPGKGILVTGVADDSPADTADLEAGDIIISADGIAVDNPPHFRRIVRKKHPGDTIRLEVVHDGRKKTLTVALDDFEGSEGPMAFFRKWTPRVFQFLRGDMPYMGVTLQDVNKDLAKYFRIDAGKGVLITQVEDGSPADKGGLKSGDVLTKIEGERVGSSDDVRKILYSCKPGDTIAVRFIRSRKPKRRKITLEESPVKEHLDTLEHFWDEVERQRDSLQRQLNRLREWTMVNGTI